MSSRRRSSLVAVHADKGQQEGSVPLSGILILLVVLAAIAAVWINEFAVDEDDLGKTTLYRISTTRKAGGRKLHQFLCVGATSLKDCECDKVVSDALHEYVEKHTRRDDNSEEDVKPKKGKGAKAAKASKVPEPKKSAFDDPLPAPAAKKVEKREVKDEPPKAAEETRKTKSPTKEAKQPSAVPPPPAPTAKPSKAAARAPAPKVVPAAPAPVVVEKASVKKPPPPKIFESEEDESDSGIEDSEEEGNFSEEDEDTVEDESAETAESDEGVEGTEEDDEGSGEQSGEADSSQEDADGEEDESGERRNTAEVSTDEDSGDETESSAVEQSSEEAFEETVDYDDDDDDSSVEASEEVGSSEVSGESAADESDDDSAVSASDEASEDGGETKESASDEENSTESDMKESDEETDEDSSDDKSEEEPDSGSEETEESAETEDSDDGPASSEDVSEKSSESDEDDSSTNEEAEGSEDGSEESTAEDASEDVDVSGEDDSSESDEQEEEESGSEDASLEAEESDSDDGSEESDSGESEAQESEAASDEDLESQDSEDESEEIRESAESASEEAESGETDASDEQSESQEADSGSEEDSQEEEGHDASSETEEKSEEASEEGSEEASEEDMSAEEDISVETSEEDASKEEDSEETDETEASEESEPEESAETGEEVEEEGEVISVVVTKSKKAAKEPKEAPIPKVVLDGVRDRSHIAAALGFSKIGTQDDAKEEKLIQQILKEIKKSATDSIKPLERDFKFSDISQRVLGDAEIFNKPMALFLGPWSSGKSTAINYLLGTHGTRAALKTGPQPTDSFFTVLHHNEDGIVRESGIQMAGDSSFSGVNKFGTAFLSHFRGVGLNHPLLKKVMIVDTPGIIDGRRFKDFPLNDVFQWFIDRADAIYVMFDPSKLEIGLDMKALLDQLRGREQQTRFLLNKGDLIEASEVMRVTGQLLWNVAPLFGSSDAPIIYTVSMISRPYLPGSPVDYFQDQEEEFLRHLKEVMDERVENTIMYARRHAVRVRNHVKLVDCYLEAYYKNKGMFGNKKRIAEQIIKDPAKYNIFDTISQSKNVSKYDLLEPEDYAVFFKLNPLPEFSRLKDLCGYVKGCPIDKLDRVIAYDLPQLLKKYQEKSSVFHDSEEDRDRSKAQAKVPTKSKPKGKSKSR